MPVTKRASNPASHGLVTDLRTVIGKLRRRLREEVGIGELSWPQATVISIVDREGPITTTELARIEGMRPQSMGATVAALIDLGLLAASPHPSDGRQTLLSVTAKARRFLDEQRAAREDWLQRIIESYLNPVEQRELARGVELLRRIAEVPWR